jgi:hypothetical protein
MTGRGRRVLDLVCVLFCFQQITDEDPFELRKDMFNVSQVYAIIVLPNGGPDLEAYAFTSASKSGWRQACSIFWQVTKALAHAEQLVSFEVTYSCEIYHFECAYFNN